ncbi:caspase family protein [Magnetospira sp. QH-2]|uniref:caspase family protein n=1 Tax=Magnetospira sp. (strain QH-2) TaxID=1288970 RepID=UPI00130DA561|nr:caspase family protein [Magnetospira sp. QH-2]
MSKWLCLGVAALVLGLVFEARAEHDESIAVIIGNKDYTSDRIPDAAYAHNDAEAFKGYLIDVLDFQESNIIDLRDATQAQTEEILGNHRHHEGTLWQYVRPRRSHVILYFSGQGLMGDEGRQGYLLPIDSSPRNPAINGYPLDILLNNLAKLKARSVTIYIEASFSGDSGGGRWTGNNHPPPSYPWQQVLPAGVVVISAAERDQAANWDDQADLGLFTNHLLSALYGMADTSGYGNQDRVIKASEVKAYLDDKMTYDARRRFGRKQEAVLLGDEGAVVSSSAPDNPQSRPKTRRPARIIHRTGTRHEPAPQRHEQKAYEAAKLKERTCATLRKQKVDFDKKHGNCVFLPPTLNPAQTRKNLDACWNEWGNKSSAVAKELQRNGC